MNYRTAAALVLLGATSAAQAQLLTNTTPGSGTYANSISGSNTNFGNVLGTGSLAFSQSGNDLTISFTKGAGNFNDAVVIYLDPQGGSPTGFSDTGGFTDTSDGLRRAISGFDGGSSRSTLFFAPGFNATHAIAFKPFGTGNGFAGLWSLTNGGSHNFIASGSLSPENNTSATYSMTFSLPAMAVTPGNHVDFVANYIAESAFRSSEFLGVSSGPADNPGTSVNVALASNDYNRFVSAAVPEPSALMLLLFPAGLLRRRRS
jgi:hypothetical protein